VKRIVRIENPFGKGEVWGKGAKIATVSYILSVLQEIETVSYVGGNEQEEIEGSKSTGGLIDAGKDLLSLLNEQDKLTLHLQDGRKIDFFVKDANVITGKIQIQPVGGFY
jgi:hypothetical protein